MSNYVEEAREVVKKLPLIKNVEFNENGQNNFKLTTTQIRKILSISASIYDKCNSISSEDFEKKIKPDLDNLKIQLVYQAGRIQSVKTFVKKAKILEKINECTDIAKTKNFCKYLESLVAWFKFYGGKE